VSIKSNAQTSMEVPFFRPSIQQPEIDEVVACLQSGWLTTGPKVRRFEEDFAACVRAKFAIGLNSCTAALHLAVEALGLESNQAVLVPTMTFAATAEIVRYQRAVPILVDCDPITFNMDLEDAERKMRETRAGELPQGVGLEVVGIIPVHVGGLMMDMSRVADFASRHGLWIVEDAAHALPAAFRSGPQESWRRCGEDTADVTCFSFYANKTITTGEGGMATTKDANLGDRMRQMSLHGLSNDAWERYERSGDWDYGILAPGYKYNLTDIAAALGVRQLERADSMRRDREMVAYRYLDALADVEEVELPPNPVNRQHSWHLFPIRLRLGEFTDGRDRNAFTKQLAEMGVGTSVHWRPLHQHPYYKNEFKWKPDQLPVASREWQRLVSLPIFPGLKDDEQAHVISAIRQACMSGAVAVPALPERETPVPAKKSKSKQIFLSPPDMAGDERKALLEAFDSGWIAPQGPHVTMFEEAFAERIGVPYAVAVSSGTAALHLAMVAIGVGPGDEIATSTLTFVASVNAIRYAGAQPVLIDSEQKSWNLDPDLLAEELEASARRDRPLKAVVVVDVFGQCADYEAIQNVCQFYEVPIIEDAAEALGATYKGRPAGTFGEIGCFSFNGNKIITTSAGGMLVTESRVMAERVRYLATQARAPAAHYEHEELGFNCAMSNILAALGRAQLNHLDSRIESRRANYHYYVDALGHLPGIEFMPEPSDSRSTRWLTCITVDSEKFGATREDIRLALKRVEIEARPVWKPMHLQPLYSQCRVRGGAVSERLFDLGLCLPSGSNLSKNDLARVVRVIQSAATPQKSHATQSVNG
jgi:dTDP-4-amino-4,6-dideoxygalactose transaminase